MGKRRPPNPSLRHPRASSLLNEASRPSPPRKRRARGRSADAVERIADRAHGAQQIGAAGGIERLAQPADMDIDGAHLDLGIVAPYPVEQLLARKHAAGMLQKMAQQAVFGRPEMDRLSG